MDISKLSNDGLMFHYFSNKKQLDLIYRQQKELESEIERRLNTLRIKCSKGDFTIFEESGI